MAEDQGVNGDIWNKEAVSLLKEFGWISIGDNNIDIKGIDKKKHGIDTLIKYEGNLFNRLPQGFFLEAKRYETKNFKAVNFRDWVNTLDNKIRLLRGSIEMEEQFPDFSNSDARNGIIMIWFADVANYNEDKLKKALKSISPKNPSGLTRPSRIFVLDNYHILRLCSLKNSIENIESKKEGFKNFKFYYPSVGNNSNPIFRSNSLSIEYMFSKFILGEAIYGANKEVKIVFFFGNPIIQNFKLLKDCLLNLNFIDSDKDLILFLYKRDDNQFRKIRPDVENLFSSTSFSIRQMDILADLPSWIKN
ncbi:hypothetical protein KI659_16695 [Litoribacter alkaliphilus]|uniref:GAPS4 PD-(D/E)XK nuclease domain-containing protein n=1 Tax=Litoribacter ruber TaxID=702568 RepID=A0AAP2CL10_9BACT|nr:hypothetical protein [Litoribacter alkaliphilus]MBS9525659.1 hypothetical protein [Litoribacter alkaliphilus]